MKTLKNLLLIIVLFLSFTAKSQCGYETSSLQITHLNCYKVPTGEIDLLVLNTNTSFNWQGPPHWNTGIPFSSTSLSITSLYAGDYILTIYLAGDSCLTDTFTVNQTNDISATYLFNDICDEEDSVDVILVVTGGTPYNTGESYNYTITNSFSLLVGQNDTLLNLPPDLYSLSITDKNGCTPKHNQNFNVDSVMIMNPFMSSVGTICKDDNSGEARVFVQEGTPPFTFNWGIEGDVFPQENDVLVVDSFSSISGLSPGVYVVEIIDDMGCTIKDSIEVKSNPNICLTIYKAFSPNDDDTHEFWKIENIELYPEAVVSVYDRNGRQVFKRRNYLNAVNVAFGGKDANGQPLPSATYYYVVNLENGDDVFKGTVTIVR